MEDLSLHILDIAENSIAAGAKNIEIIITINSKDDRLTIEINDDGKGMNEEAVKSVTDPFYTSRTTRKVGLGLPMLEEAAKQADGSLTIQSKPNAGTKIKAEFILSHIDRKPIGNMADTMVALIASDTNIDIKYIEKKDDTIFQIDTKEIKNKIPKDTINRTEILSFIKNYIKEHTLLSDK